MIREASAMMVRKNLGELLNEVQYRHGIIMITKAGKPVAALVDITLFDRIRKLDEEFDQLRKNMAEKFSGKSEKEIDALINEAIKTTRKQYKKM